MLIFLSKLNGLSNLYYTDKIKFSTKKQNHISLIYYMADFV